MPVKFSLYRADGEIQTHSEGTSCFGRLAGYSGYPSGTVDNPCRFSFVRYWPTVHKNLVNRPEVYKRFLDHVFSIPAVRDGLREMPNYSDVLSEDWYVDVSCEQAADKMMNILCLIRFTFLAHSVTKKFYELTEAEVDPAIAFTVCVGGLEAYVEGQAPHVFKLAVGMDTEHAFVDARHFSLRDAVNMATVFHSEDYQELYSGRQDVYRASGRYVRGSSGNGEQTRLTAYCAPTIASSTARRAEDLSLPFVLGRFKNASLYDHNRETQQPMNDMRMSNCTLNFGEMMDAVSWFEDYVNEQRQ